MRMLVTLLLSAAVALGQFPDLRLVGATRGVTVRLTGSSSSTTGATSYTATIDFIKEESLLFAMVINTKASAPDIPTFSGGGLTWTQIRTTNYNTLASPVSRLTVFYASQRSGTYRNATATADFAGATQTGCIIGLVEVTGAFRSFGPTNALVQIVHGGNNVNTNAVATLGAFSGTRNLALAFVGGSLNSQNCTAEPGWTKLFGANYNTPATEGVIVYQLKSADTSVLVTNAASINWASVAVEVKQQ